MIWMHRNAKPRAVIEVWKKNNLFPIAPFWPLLINLCKRLTPLNWVDAFLRNSDIGSSKLSLLSTITPVFLSKLLQFSHFKFQACLVQNVLRFKSFVKNVSWNLYGLTFDFLVNYRTGCSEFCSKVNSRSSICLAVVDIVLSLVKL